MHLVIAYKYLHMNVSEPPTFDHPDRGCGGMAKETPRTGRRPTQRATNPSATMNWSLILHGRKGREAQTTPEIIVHGKLWRQTLVQQAETNLTSHTEAAAYMQCMFPFAAHTRLHTHDHVMPSVGNTTWSTPVVHADHSKPG